MAENTEINDIELESVAGGAYELLKTYVTTTARWEMMSEGEKRKFVVVEIDGPICYVKRISY